MNDDTTADADLDRMEEDVLTYEVADEDLEAAAGRLAGAIGPTSSFKGISCCFGC